MSPRGCRFGQSGMSPGRFAMAVNHHVRHSGQERPDRPASPRSACSRMSAADQADQRESPIDPCRLVYDGANVLPVAVPFGNRSTVQHTLADDLA